MTRNLAVKVEMTLLMRIFAVVKPGVRVDFVNTSGKAGAKIPQLPLGDDSSPWGR
jgi:hypothetical protein